MTNHEYNKQYSKERYDYLKSRGLCPKCGKNKHADGFVLCADCICEMAIKRKRDSEKESKRYKAYYQDKREKGLCVCCGKNANGKAYCQECAIKQSLRKKAKKTPNFRLDTECRICRKPVLDGFKYCEEHYKQQRENMLRARAMRTRTWNNNFLFNNC